MSSTCIITDSSVQFTQPGLPGKQCLKILSHELWNMTDQRSPLPKVSEFPKNISGEFHPIIYPPTEKAIFDLISASLPQFDDIFILLLSKELSPLYAMVERSVATLHGRANLHLIDSQNTSVGLGLLVQYAASLLSQDLPADEIEKLLRLMVSHIYTLFCAPNLSYLYNAGMLDIGQATVGEMLGLFPLFVLEEGKVNPLQKVKNLRSVIEYFVEFIDEFDDLAHVTIIQPAISIQNETKLLHQHVNEFFPDTMYTEHTLSPYIASLLGPRGFGMAIMENLPIKK